MLSITHLIQIWMLRGKRSFARLDYILNSWFLKLECKKDIFHLLVIVSLQISACFSQEHWLWTMTLHVIYLKFLCQPKVYNSHGEFASLQVVNKIITIRLTPKLLMSLSNVYVNQEGANWFFVVNMVNLLFYITRRNPVH